VSLARDRGSIVAVDHAFFHYEKCLFGLMDIFDRVAGDRDNVGELVRLQRPDLVRKSKELSVR
jgi:hypothetical protein